MNDHAGVANSLLNVIIFHSFQSFVNDLYQYIKIMIARPPRTHKNRTKRCILDIRATTHITKRTAANIHNAIKVLI